MHLLIYSTTIRKQRVVEIGTRLLKEPGSRLESELGTGQI